MSNATVPAPEIPDLDISSFVFERAAEHPDKPALIDGPSGRAITYGELEALSGKASNRGPANEMPYTHLYNTNACLSSRAKG